MGVPAGKKAAVLAVGCGAAFLGARYLLPLTLPFLLGTGLAVGAEPMVGFCVKRLRLPRPAASALGMTGALALVLGGMLFLGSLLVRELGVLAGVLPDLEALVRRGLEMARLRLTELASLAPDGLRPLLVRSVTGVFGSGTAAVEYIAGRLPGLVTGTLRIVPGGCWLWAPGSSQPL